jgi:PelA/Pel-15E family pectate lyase
MALLFAPLAAALGPSSLPGAEPISLDAFRSGIKHWKDGQNTDNYSVYAPEEVREIADNVLLYQRASGGWPPNFDPLRIVSDDEKREIADERSRQDTSFDNSATYPEVEYLASAFAQTNDGRYRDAALHGIEFILAAQYGNGGWPHSYPKTGAYYPHVTIVDNVMTGVLATLRKIAAADVPFDFVEAPLRERVADAVRRGDACLLALQVKVDGRLTGWASQYDHVTLEPTTGRTYELPALVSGESVGVLRYLMRIDDPSPEVRRAVHAGVAWLERSKISGLRLARVPATTVRYRNHTSQDDVVAVEDPQARPIWARFYEIETNRPFMANRDGRKVFRLADVTRERRTGYSWYGYYAEGLLDKDYPAWRENWDVEQ